VRISLKVSLYYLKHVTDQYNLRMTFGGEVHIINVNRCFDLEA